MPQLKPMKPINQAIMKRYLMIYKKNPRSKVFALLADIYRKKGETDKAFRLCQQGLKEHPQFALGHIAMALILMDINKLEMAVSALEKATDLAPENIFAYKTLGQVCLQLKNPEKTLKAYKMVLFLDPENKTAQNIVKKLEPMTATQYDKTGFAFKSLKEVAKYISAEPKDQKNPVPPTLHPVPKTYSQKEKQRFSSYSAMIEALIYRKEFSKAKQFLLEMKNIYDHPQWKDKIQSLEKKLPPSSKSSLSPIPFSHKKERYSKTDPGPSSLSLKSSVPHQEVTSTKTHIVTWDIKQRKIKKLRQLLTRIEQFQAHK